MKSIFNKRLRFSPLPEVDSYFSNPTICGLEAYSIVPSSSPDQSDPSVFLPLNSALDFEGSSPSPRSPRLFKDAVLLSRSEHSHFDEFLKNQPNDSSLQGRLDKVLSNLDNQSFDLSRSECRLKCAQRSPTPPPLLSPPLVLPHRSTSVPIFAHSSEFHEHRDNNSSCNNGSGGGHVDITALELYEAVSRAEMWTQHSVQGLQEHTRSLLAATEAEERRLRARLAMLQNEMAKGVCSEEIRCSAENPSTLRRDAEQADERNTSVNFNTSATAAALQIRSQYRLPTGIPITNDDEAIFHGSTMVSETSLRVSSPAIGGGASNIDYLPSPNCCYSTPPRHQEEGRDFPEPLPEIHSPNYHNSNPLTTSRHLLSDDSSGPKVVAAPEVENNKASRPEESPYIVINTLDLAKEEEEKKLLDATGAPDSSSSMHSVSSLTEVSPSLKLLSEGNNIVQQTLVDLLKEESKQLKAARAAYKSKKKVITELKALLQQNLNLPQSEMSASSSDVNTKENEPVLIAAASLPKPESPSEPSTRQEISAKPQQQHSDNLPREDAKSAEPDVERMYMEFIKRFDRSRITRIPEGSNGEVRSVSVGPEGGTFCTRCHCCLHYVSCCSSTVCLCNHRIHHPCVCQSAQISSVHLKPSPDPSELRCLGNNHIGPAKSTCPQGELEREAVVTTNLSDGCAWTESLSMGKRSKPIMPSFTSQCRPDCKDRALGPSAVKLNTSRTNPPYACDQELAFNHNNTPSECISPKTLQEAFRLRMQAFIARSEARQRLIRLEALERRMKAEQKALRTATDSSSTTGPSWMNLSTCLDRQKVKMRQRSAEGQSGKWKPLMPYEAHRLLRLQQNSRSLINRERMKKFSEVRTGGVDQTAPTITKVTIETLSAPHLELLKTRDQREIPANRLSKRRKCPDGFPRCRKIFTRSEDIEKELQRREEKEAVDELEKELERRELKEEVKKGRKILKSVHYVLITIK
ncbi:hypothetical protein Aperf_G00000126283 [Anoplocephala perfoliata]